MLETKEILKLSEKNIEAIKSFYEEIKPRLSFEEMEQLDGIICYCQKIIEIIEKN